MCAGGLNTFYWPVLEKFELFEVSHRGISKLNPLADLNAPTNLLCINALESSVALDITPHGSLTKRTTRLWKVPL